MKTKSLLFTLLLILLSTSCKAEISGTVVDAETGAPIEGAVVLVEWTKTKGLPGLTHTESYKVVEKLTDQDGRFSISGVWTPFVNKPDITVYKKGYVAWNNKFIFPDYKKREDIKWSDKFILELEHFKPEYSYIDHQAFISGAIHVGLGSENKHLFLKTYDEGEETAVIKERSDRDKTRSKQR